MTWRSPRPCRPAGGAVLRTATLDPGQSVVAVRRTTVSSARSSPPAFAPAAAVDGLDLGARGRHDGKSQRPASSARANGPKGPRTRPPHPTSTTTGHRRPVRRPARTTVAGGAFDRRCCSCRKRTTTDSVVASPVDQNVRRQRVVLADAACRRPGGPRTPNCQRDWFLLTSRGKGRAGNPRRAPRRRRRGPGPRSVLIETVLRWPRLGEQRGHRILEVKQPVCGLVAGERGDGVVARAAPSRCSESAARSGPATPSPACRGGPRIPTTPAATEKPRSPWTKTVPLKRNSSGTVAVAQGVQILRRRRPRSRRCTPAAGDLGGCR